MSSGVMNRCIIVCIIEHQVCFHAIQEPAHQSHHPSFNQVKKDITTMSSLPFMHLGSCHTKPGHSILRHAKNKKERKGKKKMMHIFLNVRVCDSVLV